MVEPLVGFGYTFNDKENVVVSATGAFSVHPEPNKPIPLLAIFNAEAYPPTVKHFAEPDTGIVGVVIIPPFPLRKLVPIEDT
jgi:hypothetical protein